MFEAMTTNHQHHQCARCGVADEDTRILKVGGLSQRDGPLYEHPSRGHCENAKTREIAALKRENAALREREERVAVAFAEYLQRFFYHTPALSWAAFRESEVYPK